MAAPTFAAKTVMSWRWNVTEVWKTIPFAPEYEASSLGRIRRPVAYRGPANRILRMAPNSHGYPSVTLCTGGKRLSVTAHRAVAAAWLGPRPDGYDIAHFDGDQNNPAPSNLRYCTRQENILDKNRHGTMAAGEAHGRRVKPERTARGERHGCAKLTAEIVSEIRALKMTQVEIAKRYGLSQTHVSDIRARKIWAHLPEEQAA